MSQIPVSNYLLAIGVGVITSPYTIGPAQVLVAPALVITGLAAAIFALKSVVHGKCVKKLNKSGYAGDNKLQHATKISNHNRKQSKAKDNAIIALAGAAFFACSVIPVFGTAIGAVVVLHIHDGIKQRRQAKLYE